MARQAKRGRASRLLSRGQLITALLALVAVQRRNSRFFRVSDHPVDRLIAYRDSKPFRRRFLIGQHNLAQARKNA